MDVINLVRPSSDMKTEERYLLEECGPLEGGSAPYSHPIHRAKLWLSQLPLHCSKVIQEVQRQQRLKVIINLLLFGSGFMTGLLLPQNRGAGSCSPHSVSYSPAIGAISYEIQSQHSTDHSIHRSFSGPPSLDQGKAWENLVSPVMIRASHKEMVLAKEDPDNSVQLLSGDYLASLGVYHNLHCLRRIRFFLYKAFYYPNMTSQQQSQEEKHIDHCIESLRLSVMCTGETGLYTFEWKPNATRVAAKSNSARECIDWMALERWAKRRSVGFNPALQEAAS